MNGPAGPCFLPISRGHGAPARSCRTLAALPCRSAYMKFGTDGAGVAAHVSGASAWEFQMVLDGREAAAMFAWEREEIRQELDAAAMADKLALRCRPHGGNSSTERERGRYFRALLFAASRAASADCDEARFVSTAVPSRVGGGNRSLRRRVGGRLVCSRPRDPGRVEDSRLQEVDVITLSEAEKRRPAENVPLSEARRRRENGGEEHGRARSIAQSSDEHDRCRRYASSWPSRPFVWSCLSSSVRKVEYSDASTVSVHRSVSSKMPS